MKTLLNILFIVLLLSIPFSKSNENNSIRLLQFEDDNRGIHGPPPPGEREDLDIEKQKLENDYQKKLEENNKLKQQIENNIKYIKILLTTGVIMFSIILFILIKIIFNYKNSKTLGLHLSSNSSIKSNDNSLDLGRSINIPNNKIGLSEMNNNDSNKKKNNNMSENEEIVNNGDCDAPNMANFSNVVINDDNKTLTNNPDVFIPSKMDKILYKPYPIEEIK